jgi:L-seryl-tRNA(Ser) seleniumtransferase
MLTGPMAPGSDNPYRALPSTDRLLAHPDLVALGQRTGRSELRRLVQQVLAQLRGQLAAAQGEPSPDLADRLQEPAVLAAVQREAAAEGSRGLVPVVNASGVVLNTGLGRAPVHPEAAAAMARAAAGYCTLEVDRATGRRNQRDEHVGELAARLTGAEAAIAVNNCAAAVLLALQTLAGGRAAAVSRGELVEIGGSFRMPEVMRRAGVGLVEVGATNRTRLADYRAALEDPGRDVALLLKVHTSNYRLVGFTEEVTPAALAELGRAHGLPTVYDLGSGRIDPEGAAPLDFLGDEPGVERAVASGVDLVLFSGDKLLGGPQAGLIVGRAATVAALRENPLYRALRLDKTTLAGLEVTLRLLLGGRGDELPARAQLLRPLGELEAAARRLAQALGRLPELRAEVLEDRTQPGSGTAPQVFVPSWSVAVEHRQLSPSRLAEALRLGEPCVFARVQADRLRLDLRTLLPGDEQRLVTAFARLA